MSRMFGRSRKEEEYRHFIRELLLRFDRTAAEARAEFRAQREESREYFAALRAEAAQQRRRTDELLEHSRELRAESRAQSEALIHVLAKLNNGGPASAAAD
jgi:hypothetical protein